ncbi:MAG: Uma2 family endonuclease [Chroococcidiopsidaceae cyanobacterium CP_BM_ER_R8_30]|nr:Uma2 family endonuclease [Chroococcidiopsidaceae cyanobacterium CP_BM_ER_R8_30]
MTPLLQQRPLTFDEFLDHYGDDDRYELIDREIFDLEPTGPHEEVAAFIDRKLNVQIDTLELPYFIPQRCLIKPLGNVTGFRPDLVVLDRSQLAKEPLWSQEPVITMGSSIRLVVEVVSTNWQNDYARKVEDYAALGIAEYWIADYAALGGVQFLGRIKQPTLSICELTDGIYEARRLRGNERVVSPTFPNLQLTAEQILKAGQY